MTTLDWVTIALYFGLLAGLTWWSVARNRDTADDYFLAGRNLGWLVVGASIFASNIGSEHPVGLIGAGATSGVALAHVELHTWCLLVLGWVLVPLYLRSRVYTMPEFLELRFSATARWVLSLISLVAYVLTKMAVGIFQGARRLYDSLQGIQAYLAAPIAAVFFFGVFMRRLTGAGCLAALLTGFGRGVLRLLVETPVTLGMPGYHNGYPPGSWLWILNDI
jgi:SSS family solute:Na+ symporter